MYVVTASITMIAKRMIALREAFRRFAPSDFSSLTGEI
jgi:hypothetical protein